MEDTPSPYQIVFDTALAGWKVTIRGRAWGFYASLGEASVGLEQAIKWKMEEEDGGSAT